jgi:nucleoside-diphosphate-sugar epimerase
MPKQHVLVTGSAGRLGQAMCQALARAGHQVSGLDVRSTPGLSDQQCHVGSLLDADLLQRAMTGHDAVIHLAATPDDAAFPRQAAPHDTDNFEDELLPNNILGSYRLLEAVRRVGIPKVILASTGQVIDGHLDANRVPVTQGSAYAPRYLYACTKVFLEQLGHVYAVNHGIKVLLVRFGWCPRTVAHAVTIATHLEEQDTYLSPGDAGRFAVCAVEADATLWQPFTPVYCTSIPKRHMLYDLAPAKKFVGYSPADAWPVGSEALLTEASAAGISISSAAMNSAGG